MQYQKLVKDPLSKTENLDKIQSVMRRFVSQEGYDSEFDNIIQYAAEYIDYLEVCLEKISELVTPGWCIMCNDETDKLLCETCYNVIKDMKNEVK